MPRYIFHVDGDPTGAQAEGYEIVDLETAKCEAVKLAGTLICEAGDTFWDKGDWRMTVSDETGLTLFDLIFAGYEAAALGRAS